MNDQKLKLVRNISLIVLLLSAPINYYMEITEDFIIPSVTHIFIIAALVTSVSQILVVKRKRKRGDV
jgi:hypothetical protein